jgi:hypothetical protein
MEESGGGGKMKSDGFVCRSLGDAHSLPAGGPIASRAPRAGAICILRATSNQIPILAHLCVIIIVIVARKL